MPRVLPSSADSTAASRIASIGSVRAARRAGIMTDRTVMIVPSAMPPTMFDSPEAQPTGQRPTGHLQDPVEKQGQHVARDHAEQGPQNAQHQPLEPQRALQLAWGRADGGEDGELAQPLGDDDAEGVEDDEPTDQQREDGERRSAVFSPERRTRSSRAGRRGTGRRSGPRSRRGGPCRQQRPGRRGLRTRAGSRTRTRPGRS